MGRADRQRASEQVTPLLAFPREIWRVIHTTNAIKSLNRSPCVR